MSNLLLCLLTLWLMSIGAIFGTDRQTAQLSPSYVAVHSIARSATQPAHTETHVSAARVLARKDIFSVNEFVCYFARKQTNKNALSFSSAPERLEPDVVPGRGGRRPRTCVRRRRAPGSGSGSGVCCGGSRSACRKPCWKAVLVQFTCLSIYISWTTCAIIIFEPQSNPATYKQR